MRGTRCGPGGGRAWGGGCASGVHGEKARLKAWGPGRTSNMPCKLSTILEVSKLSGWLNFCAFCQPKGGACDMGRGAGGEAVGSGAAQAGMQTGKVRPQGLGVRARAGRTSNMFCMFVTLEVSQLSGWLKACASCRVEREGHAMRGEVRTGRREGVRRRRRKQRARLRPDSKLGGQGTRGAHVEHLLHVRDLGRVEAERLVELVRLLPSRS